MSDVALVHMDLHSKGGGEAVAMNCLEVLQERHDLTLITLTDPNIEELNEYFNTNVDPAALTIRRAGTVAPTINRLFGVKYYVLQNALLGRYARRHEGEFDLLVSTINELGLPAGSIEYVHFPFDWTVSLDNRGDIFHPTVGVDSLYERLCTYVAEIDGEDLDANTVFANSDWTAECFEIAYGIRPKILYPPIDTSEFTDVPWAERENGFVTVGRIERSKHTAEMIEIVDGVRERGHDVHLHIIGPTYDDEYRAELDEMAESRPYVEFEGELPRSELVEMISTHRYGLHGKEHEHFGMAVAEIAAGAAIPFVPSSGGQSAIVRGDDRLIYDSIDEATEKIDRVLSETSLQRELQMEAGEIERRFGRERFRGRIRTAVSDALGRSIPAEEPAQRAVGNAQSVDD